MSEVTQRVNAYAIWVSAMAQSLERRDEHAFLAALAGFDAVRDADIMTGVRKVALDLQGALDRFRENSKLVELAERQVPDARHRLAHVLKLTDDAAHRTMDLVERCCPLADRTAREAGRLLGEVQGTAAQRVSEPLLAFLQQTAASMTSVRTDLAEVLLAQGYQDLSGQIIRGVMGLVDHLEVALRELVQITGAGRSLIAQEVGDDTCVMGPVVPGISYGNTVNGQQDIDALLSDLGV